MEFLEAAKASETNGRRTADKNALFSNGSLKGIIVHQNKNHSLPSCVF